MRRAFSVVVVLFAIAMACRIPDEHYVVGDGPAGGDGQSLDTAPDTPPPPCNLTAPFGTPKPVMGLDVLGSVARFSSDEMTAYFGIDADGSGSGAIELYKASRAGSGQPFTTRTLLSALADPLGVTTPATAPNDLAIYYVHDEVDPGTARDLYVATRTSVGSDFGNPKVVAGVNDGSAEDDFPSIASNGDLWWSSKRVGDSTVSIYHALNVGNGFGAPSEVVQLNDAGAGNFFPVLTPDLLQIYFSRNSGSIVTAYMATRGSAGATFSTPVTLDAINALGSYRPAWISPDGCRLYLGEGAPMAPVTMYVSSRPAP